MPSSTETPRLSESTLPLAQISLDSVHEKNVRHGRLSTLHIWPARRPLAASRAMILATLLPDPGDTESRRRLGVRMAGRLVPKRRKDGGEHSKLKETAGGILHWGRQDGPELGRLRDEIRAAFGGRAPRVLDPFAGGGAIPLEAMRLGCETFASDLNPVAWFILRCTLHYPRLVGREELPLPDFALRDRDFATALVKARGAKTKVQIRNALAELGHGDRDDIQLSSHLLDGGPRTRADFAWHLRAWGLRVLGNARRALAANYPTFADFEPVRRKGRARMTNLVRKPYRPRDPRLLEPGPDGRVSTDALNGDFDSLYLEDEANPRWVAKLVVAYLWARTAECGGCRAEIPLLKTRWLCKKPGKRVRLTVTVREGGVDFGVETDVPAPSGSAAQKRAHDKALGAGTMSGSGVECPCCGSVTRMAELRVQGRAGRLGARMTAVVVAGQTGKDYRTPTEHDIRAASIGRDDLAALYAEVPFGMPGEPTPKAGVGASRAFSVDGYGFDSWNKLFTDRQLLALGTFVRERAVRGEMDGYADEWREALTAYLACILSKLTDYSSAICSWHNSGEKLRQTFARFALPMVWDFCEVNPLSDTTGGFRGMADWTARVVDHALRATTAAPPPEVATRSAIARQPEGLDLICTDPPYYDAIPYSDLMDFFHIWLRRTLDGLSPETEAAFAEPLGPKWESGADDGELIDDASRFEGDRAESKRNYEDGMARAFVRFHEALKRDGRLVVVFANKSPDARGRPWSRRSSARASSSRDHGRSRPRCRPGSGPWPRPPSPPPSGSYAASAPGPRASAGRRACSPTCANASPSSSVTSGTRAFADPTSCGRPPDRCWRRSAATPSSRAPTAPARRHRLGIGQRRAAQALEAPPPPRPGPPLVRRERTPSDRLRPQGHAALEDRRGGSGERLPGRARPAPKRALRQRGAGRAGDGRGRVGRACVAGVGAEPSAGGRGGEGGAEVVAVGRGQSMAVKFRARPN